MEPFKLFTFLALTIVITSCTNLVPTLVPVQNNDQSGDESTQIQRTELTFEGNGNTFLTQISNTIDELGTPQQHRYVTFNNGTGQPIWQGEQLIYIDQTVLFVQAVGLGGRNAIQLEADKFLTDEEILDALGMPTSVSTSQPDAEIRFVRARYSDGLWSFDVTLNHEDTGWADYTDGWHVETPDGEILGTRILLHPHVNEMPFTRSLSRVQIPDDMTEVHIRSHDLVSGYGLETVVVPVMESGKGERFEVIR